MPWGCLQSVIVVFPDHPHIIVLITSGNSVVVDSLFIVAPIVFFFCYVNFCGVALCTLLLRKGELVVFH